MQVSDAFKLISFGNLYNRDLWQIIVVPYVHNQGRNFDGLKSGGTNSEGERDALGYRGEKEENGEQIPPHPSNSGICESGVRGGALTENGFIVI